MRFLLPSLVIVVCGVSALHASIFNDVADWTQDGVDDVVHTAQEMIGEKPAHQVVNAGTPDGTSSCNGSNRKCQKNFIPWNGRCYFFSRNRVSWYNALTICQNVANGSLLEVYSQKEMEFVAKVLQRINITGEYWLGATDFLDHTNFIWMSTQHSVDQSFWAPNEPNNAGGWERCLEVRKTGLTNDDACSTEQLYICDYPVCKDHDIKATN